MLYLFTCKVNYMKKYQEKNTSKISSFIIKKFQKRPKVFDVITLILLIFFINNTYFQDIKFEITSFVNDTISKLNIAHYFSSFSEFFEYKKKYQQLFEQFNSLNAKNLSLQNYEKDIQSLKILLNIKVKQCPEAKFANIISKMCDDYGSYAIVDIGMDCGVKTDSIVIFNDVLVGKIVEVYNESSKVMFVSDKNFHVPVLMVEKNADKNVEDGNDQTDGKKDDENNSNNCEKINDTNLKNNGSENSDENVKNKHESKNNLKIENDLNYLKIENNFTKNTENNLNSEEKDCSLSGCNFVSNRHAIVSGYMSNRLKIKNTNSDFVIKEGDIAVCSGSGGTFLQGLKVGYVEYSNNSTVILRPMLDLISLKYVCVI